MVFKYAHEMMDYDFIPDIARLEHAAYPAKARETEEALRARYEANRESIIFAFHNFEIVGYIWFFPISRVLSERMNSKEYISGEDIRPTDIKPYPDKYTPEDVDFDILIHSVAVLGEYQQMHYGEGLIKEFFVFISNKIISGNKINGVYTYAYTNPNAWLFEKSEFGMVKDFKGAVEDIAVRLMRYNFTDLNKEANMFLYVPFFLETEQDLTGLNIKSEAKGAWYLDKLNGISQLEFGDDIARKITRVYLGKDTFALVDEERTVGSEPVHFDLAVIYYKHFYVAVLVFDNFKKEPTWLLDQAAMNSLVQFSDAWGMLDDEDKLDNDKSRDAFRKYFAKKIGFDLSKIRQVGEVRSMTSLIKRPLEIHLVYMMACERYTGSEFKITRIAANSRFYEDANTDYAQYDFCKIYASEKNVVFITADDADRADNECLMLFIMELLMLQLCSIYSVYDEIMEDLEKGDYTNAIIDRVNHCFSSAAPLWNADNFTYSTAKKIHEDVANKFGIPRLREESQLNLDLFEKIALITSQRTTQKYILFFSFLAGYPAINAVINAFVDMIGSFTDTARFEGRVNATAITLILYLLVLVSYVTGRLWRKYLVYAKNKKP
ncbi:MAG: hypothetical protein FWB88_04455 [Defluviitaleaceae bacterium]|nr:hypothetical protein [Defluviitaleaceae bacterium]MCL2239665.1 hypothetical protein [Defluviitaleaceae bacterium]